jgi:hypothetical protein
VKSRVKIANVNAPLTRTGKSSACAAVEIDSVEFQEAKRMFDLTFALTEPQ